MNNIIWILPLCSLFASIAQHLQFKIFTELGKMTIFGHVLFTIIQVPDSPLHYDNINDSKSGETNEPSVTSRRWRRQSRILLDVFGVFYVGVEVCLLFATPARPFTGKVSLSRKRNILTITWAWRIKDMIKEENSFELLNREGIALFKEFNFFCHYRISSLSRDSREKFVQFFAFFNEKKNEK